MNGTELIAAERQRQIDAEGWTAEHDAAAHRYGDIIHAAVAYALAATDSPEPTWWWPWGPEWFKPTTPIRNLVKAGALIAAEIDRLAAGSSVKSGEPQ